MLVMLAVKALTTLRVCTGSTKPSLLAYAMSTEIPSKLFFDKYMCFGLPVWATAFCRRHALLTLVLTLDLPRKRNWLLYFNCLLVMVAFCGHTRISSYIMCLFLVTNVVITKSLVNFRVN